MPLPFSALERNQMLQTADAESFDLIIVGGGITGAGIALDAVSRGLKTILLEKNDFSWGTSSRSTKLIHGGLRYLKQFEIALVREVGKERAVVHRNARHIVIPERMLLPIVKGGSLGKNMSSLGLWVYDKLAGVEKKEQRRMLSKAATKAAEPLLRDDILLSGGLYYEYRTDDSRLTIEVLKSAVERGALALNHIMATGFLTKEGKVTGVQAKDQFTGLAINIKAKKVINATGPWVDEVRTANKETIKGKRLHLTKGIHIVVPFERLPLRQSVYFDVESDGRMVFAIPRGKITYIGTTDTTYKEKIERPLTLISDVEYVLKAANAMFPGVGLTKSDVVSTWAGLRPLIHEDGKSPSELSRKDEIFISENGLISIAGGKLTGYRKMAERILDLTVRQLKSESEQYKDILPCQTKTIQVAGGDFNSQKELHTFVDAQAMAAKEMGVDRETIVELSQKYGRNITLILHQAKNYLTTDLTIEESLHKAEIWYCIHHEMCLTLSDYLIQRTGRLYFDRQRLEGKYQWYAKLMSEMLGWDEATLQENIETFEQAYFDVVAFREEARAKSQAG